MLQLDGVVECNSGSSEKSRASSEDLAVRIKMKMKIKMRTREGMRLGGGK